MATLHPYLGVTKEAGYGARRRNNYIRNTQKRFTFNVNRKTEKALLKWLEDNKPYQTAMKRLIREQIAREKKEKRAK